MSNIYWSVRHLPSRLLLPEKLERGRAYFIDDEQVIIIDYGRGPVVYGGRPGPAGAPGEPVPQLQGQIDYLAEASQRQSAIIKKVNDMRIRDIQNLTSKHNSDIEDLAAKHDSDIESVNSKLNSEIEAVTAKHDSDIESMSDTLSSEIEAMLQKHNADIESLTQLHKDELNDTSEDLQKIIALHNDRVLELIHYNSEAVSKVMKLCYNKFNQFEKAIYTLFKLIASLYPNADFDMYPDDDNNQHLLTPGEVLNTNSGNFKVRNSFFDSDSGAVVVIIDVLNTPDSAYVETLSEGDSFSDNSGHVWTVRENKLTDSEGTILLSQNEAMTLAETLKQGDTITADGKVWTVNYVSYDSGTLTLSLSE